MYYFPFLLLTEDDIRNGTIADLFEDDMIDTLAYKKLLYESLPDDMPIRSLTDLSDIQLTVNKILCETLRSNMNVLKKPLPEIDNWRIKDKLKRSLTMLRRKCADILHTYDNYTFSDLLRKPDMWEDHPHFHVTRPIDWNTVFLNRISDIHRHVCKLVEILEIKLLLKNVMLKKTEYNETNLTNDTNLMNSTAKILEACRFIHRETKEYIRLIDSL
jgi:hypothetical protein